MDEANLEKNSAIQLFAQSARRTQPGFELNDAVLPAVARICRMVDGMPLAIVLAAAWTDTLSAREIAAEIEKSIDILETERRDVPDRQHSVRAVIQSSWNQVDASAQDLLQRLTVFRGGFTREATQEAAQASLRSLSQLVDKALLRRDPDTGRYSISRVGAPVRRRTIGAFRRSRTISPRGACEVLCGLHENPRGTFARRPGEGGAPGN